MFFPIFLPIGGFSMGRKGTVIFLILIGTLLSVVSYALYESYQNRDNFLNGIVDYLNEEEGDCHRVGLYTDWSDRDTIIHQLFGMTGDRISGEAMKLFREWDCDCKYWDSDKFQCEAP